MKEALGNGLNSLLKLFRFLAWYSIAVAALFYLLPLAGLLLEERYEAMNSATKFFSVIGFFAVIGAWQVMALRDRYRRDYGGGPIESLSVVD